MNVVDLLRKHGILTPLVEDAIVNVATQANAVAQNIPQATKQVGQALETIGEPIRQTMTNFQLPIKANLLGETQKLQPFFNPEVERKDNLMNLLMGNPDNLLPREKQEARDRQTGIVSDFVLNTKGVTALGGKTRAMVTQMFQTAKPNVLEDVLQLPKAVEKVEPVLNLKRNVPITDIHGAKSIIPEGEALTPYQLKGNKFLLQDDQAYIVSKNQYQNIKGQSIKAEAKEFAPELKQTEETVKGFNIKSLEDIKNSIKQTGNNWDVGGDRWSWSIRKEGDEYKIIQFAKGEELAGITEYSDAVKELGTYKNIDEAKTVLAQTILDKKPISMVSPESTKYSQYTLPGGENYREVLIQSPTGMNEKELTKRGYWISENEQGAAILMNNRNQPQLIANNRDELKQLIKTRSEFVEGFKSSHWDEPNVISHVRLNDRLTPDGKKVTFMEEMQSDWMRALRTEAQKKTMVNGVIDNKKANEYIRKAFVGEIKTDTPITSGLKDWETTNIKRALKDAVDNNSDYFSWTNGEQQAARYNLSQQVDNIEWTPDYSGDLRIGKEGKVVSIRPNNGSSMSVVIDKNGMIKRVLDAAPNTWKDKNIAEVIGKGIGEKIMKSPNGKLSGEGLNIGGEWAYNLYDRQVKNIIEDLTSGKVEMIDLGLPSEIKENVWSNPPDYPAGEPSNLRIQDLKKGKEIRSYSPNGENYETWIIVDVYNNGKFKIVPKRVSSNAVGFSPRKGESGFFDIGEFNKSQQNEIINKLSEMEDISLKKSSGQQAIRLTPEIKAKIRGEAPKLKQPSGKSPSEIMKMFGLY